MMYLFCANDIDFASVYALSMGVWSCLESGVYFFNLLQQGKRGNEWYLSVRITSTFE